MTAPIQLDTNVLIFGLDPAHPLRQQIHAWNATGMAVSAMAWSEFLCGPVSPESVQAWDRVLNGAIIPTDRVVSERAAALFNLTGRRSRSLPDCLIAATAIQHSARLATLNRQDFAPFLAHGLTLV